MGTTVLRQVGRALRQSCEGMAAELKIHRGCTIDHIEVAVHGETRP
jgi:hypothetical protein